MSYNNENVTLSVFCRYASPSSVDIQSDSKSENMGPAQPKEFIKVNDEKMELPQVKYMSVQIKEKCFCCVFLDFFIVVFG